LLRSSVQQNASRHTHWTIRSMDDVSIGPLTVWIFIAVKQCFKQMLCLFPRHWRVRSMDVVRMIYYDKIQNQTPFASRPSSVHQSKLWKFLRPKSTRYYDYIIKEGIMRKFLVLLAKARPFPQKHVHVPGLFNRSTSFQLPVLKSRDLRA
jgi:hypothetical protein